ncbi:S_TKc protein [Globodera pallida]|nr:S_TKc protein [Globodera pallida]
MESAFNVPVMVMRTKKPRQFHSKIKSWHAPRWFGNVVHAASASLSLSSSSNNVPKLGSDGGSVAEMSSPSTSGEAGTGETRGTFSSATSSGNNAILHHHQQQQQQQQQQQPEYVPNVRLRNKKIKTATTTVNTARRRLSEQEIQKRLSLPAYINIPPSVLDKLSRAAPSLEEDSQLSRKSRRASLSEIGFGKLETYRKILGLGEGTYANVFLGQSLLTGKSVALKEIRLEHEEGAPCTAIREVSLLRNLKHSNIVTLHDVVHTDNVLTLVFEYVEKDLREYMEHLEQWICIPNVRLFLAQLLRGLAYCHSKRILHRDLKPQNLLISKNGELKLADFGLARAQSVPTKSYSSEVVTLWYRPPDVLLGSTDYSTHIDMWGVGCILYEMLAQKPMFPGSKVEEQLDLIYRRLGTPTTQLHPELCALPGFKRFAHQLRRHPSRGLVYLPCRITQERADLLQRLLAYEGKKRLSAVEAMRHPFLKCFPEALLELPDTESVLSLPGVIFYEEKSVDGLEKTNGLTRPKE